jgi:hypothetical protein
MKLNRGFLLLSLFGVFGVAVALAQEPVQEAIPNWPAPATWSPHSVSRGVSTMGAVTSPLPFIGLDPCRVADTRGNFAPIQGGINGYYAGAGTGSANTFLGLNAGNFTMTGDFNTALGSYALFRNTSGSQNTAIGYGPLSFNDQGNNNIAVGYDALVFNTGGSENIAIGHDALQKNTTGGENIAVGYQALFNTTGSTGGGNIALGYRAGSNITTGGANICIGNDGVAGDLGAIRIGNIFIHDSTFIAGIHGYTSPGGIAVYVNDSGKLGITTSSRRFKEEIRDVGEESDGLMTLRPVAFKYKPELDPSGLPQYGLIAEEVAEVYPDLVATDREGRPEAVRYHLINALLLNEVQKQHRTIESQQTEIEGLKARLSRIEARLLAESRP